MKVAFEKGEPVELDYIDTFVDGGSVKCAGDKTFKILKEVLTDICLVPEGEVCTTMIHLFNNEGILVEPAGALAISALN